MIEHKLIFILQGSVYTDRARCGMKRQVSEVMLSPSQDLLGGYSGPTLIGEPFRAGCHHVRAESGGDEEAQFFANFIIETEKLERWDNPARALTLLDVEAEEGLKL